ncbi:MAG: tRNA (adenosine(37)-N6)-dimethylallyltransferase MiaA [Atribacterota bacterium]|nr:tRNA (adenosine(37)-N6)-dimethylallyltransferase MiaA [Atribacterota bacterium]
MHKLICLVGPTRSGKTDLSFILAEKLKKVELIYADSLAVYKYLDVGTDKPSLEYRKMVPHHLIDFLDPRERWSAFDFKREVVRLFFDMTDRQVLPIVTGGTAFYLYALWQTPFYEGVPSDWRMRIWVSRLRNEQIFALLKDVDPARARKIGKNDRQRLIRAWEIVFKTGHLPSEKKRGSQGFFVPLLFGIYWEKETLKRRIAERVEEMFRRGIVEEVEGLFARGYAFPIPALDNFTYLPVVQFLRGEISLEEAKERIKKGTFLFAKRQMNWFKKWPVVWFSGENMSQEAIAGTICQFLEKEGVLHNE